jgi:signal transduction histidine kinase
MIRQSNNGLWHQLLPAYIFTKPVLFGTYFWALLIHFADSINNDSGNIILRIVIITILHTGVYGALFLFKQVVLDRVKPGLVPSLTLGALAIIGLSRGFLFENWLFAWDISTTKDAGLRMQTSLLNIVCSFSVGIIATANSRMQQKKNAQLLNELDRLEEIKVTSLARIKSVNNDAIEAIKSELEKYTKSMHGRSINEILVTLRTMIDSVVQPLSRQLAVQESNWHPPASREVNIQVNWIQAFKSGLNPGKINYVLVPSLMIFSALPTVIENSTSVFDNIFIFIAYFVAVLIGKFFSYIFANKSADFGIYLFATLATGFVMGLSALPSTQNYDSLYGFLILSTLTYPVTASLISMLFSANEQLSIASKNLAQATQELEWNVARIREAQHQNQRNLARALHGSVQAKLASAYLEIEKINLGEIGDPEKVDQLLAEIQESIATINTQQPDHEDLPGLIAKTQENWVSVAAVTSQILDLKLIQQDVLCVVALIDVIPELVFNAIKHGKANAIELSIKLKDQRIVELTVKDNGIHEVIDLGSGLGTKIMNESAISWKRERATGFTITTAEFAYSLEKSLPN